MGQQGGASGFGILPLRLYVSVGDVVLELDQNEITAALLLMNKLPLDGVIVNGDAIVRQRGICEETTFGAGEYAFMANVWKRCLRQIATIPS